MYRSVRIVRLCKKLYKTIHSGYFSGLSGHLRVYPTVIRDIYDESEKMKVADRMRTRQLTILGEDNFNVWKWSLKYNLKSLKLYECICSPNTGTQEQQDEAMLEIICTLSDNIKIKVSHCKNPYDLFQAIESIYTNKTSFQVTALHMQLSSFKFKNSEEISQGISEIQSIVSKLKNLGETVSEHMVEGIVLAALPSSFRTFVTVWKGMSAAERTLSNLFNRILAEVDDSKLFNDREDSALYAHRKSKRSSQASKGSRRHNQRETETSDESSSSDSDPDDDQDSDDGSSDSDESDIVCHYCNKKGHIKKYCRKLKKDRKKKDGMAPNTPIQASSTTDSIPDTALMAVSGEADFWFADSGATRHMTSRYEWIRDFVKFKEPVKILSADDGLIWAYGSGKIKTSVGVMRDVLYTPKLTRNLFSVGATCQSGLQIIFNKRSVKITAGKRTIVKGINCNGVYILSLDVIISEQQAGALACIQGQPEDLVEPAPKGIPVIDERVTTSKVEDVCSDIIELVEVNEQDEEGNEPDSTCTDTIIGANDANCDRCRAYTADVIKFMRVMRTVIILGLLMYIFIRPGEAATMGGSLKQTDGIVSGRYDLSGIGSNLVQVEDPEEDNRQQEVKHQTSSHPCLTRRTTEAIIWWITINSIGSIMDKSFESIGALFERRLSQPPVSGPQQPSSR